MENTLKELLEKKIYRDILRFFYKNQRSVDSAEGIAAWVGKDTDQVQEALDQLVEIGVLNRDAEGSTRGYCYTRDEDIMNIIQELMPDEDIK
ncbi:MAG: hypothetical protein GF409_01890 [Candidatus Omnitrophica bacterium]|nr:hypothetical protein [Candidatus Omnitrophota bacterium]